MFLKKLILYAVSSDVSFPDLTLVFSSSLVFCMWYNFPFGDRGFSFKNPGFKRTHVVCFNKIVNQFYLLGDVGKIKFN